MKTKLVLFRINNITRTFLQIKIENSINCSLKRNSVSWTKSTEFSFPPVSQRRIRFPLHRLIQPCGSPVDHQRLFSLSLLPEMGSAIPHFTNERITVLALFYGFFLPESNEPQRLLIPKVTRVATIGTLR